MCASNRLVKQRNNLRCSMTAYIQGIPCTPHQHGIRAGFHDYFKSEY